VPVTAPLLFEQTGAIARLTLDRPDAGNVIDLPMAQALAEAAIRCDADASIRCVVLTGRGRLFCAGGDIALFAAAQDRVPALLGELASTLHGALVRLAGMAKPLLVLVNGPLAGAGLSLALAGDVVIAARSAHFTTAYGAIGLTPDGGMTWLLPRLIGLRRAQEMLFTNRRVPADEAAAIGLITRAVDDEALAQEGEAIATRLASSATAALGATRTLLAESFGTDLETQLEREARAIATAGATRDAREGVAAFLARRRPLFEGA
jgi:2-(1,2-epoxy-1,2-dihydrophenyl)acetyl-CoA isomerase